MQKHNSAWVQSPAVDLVIGCGAWSLPLLAAGLFFAPHSQTWGLGFYSLALVLNYPHYMATIYRAYRTKEDFSRYRVVTLYFTLVVVALLAAAHASYGLVPWLFTLYITWSPWHYMGQNFGLAMMFIHRNGVKIERKDRNALWYAFIISYLLIFLTLHTNPSNDPFVISLGLPAALKMFRIPLLIAFLLVGIMTLGKLIRQAGWKPMLAPVSLFVTEFLWFALPSFASQVAYSASMLAVMHCAQYLWITTYYARQEAQAEGRLFQWQRYFGVLVVGGIALFIPGPWIASYVMGRDFSVSVLIFAAVINIHHFIVDGAIWKLRDARIRSLLTSPVARETDIENFGSRTVTRRAWRVAGAVVVGLLIVLAGVDQVRYYTASAADSRMESSFRASILVNPRNLEAQNGIARILLESGRYDEAYAHYKQMFANTDPNAEALMNFGALCKQLNHHDEAVQSFERVLKKFPDYAPAHLLLAQIFDADGKTGDAISHYERYTTLQSGATDQSANPEIQNAIIRLRQLKPNVRP